MHPLLLESTVRQCREYIEAGDCHGAAPPLERLIEAVASLGALSVSGSAATETLLHAARDTLDEATGYVGAPSWSPSMECECREMVAMIDAALACPSEAPAAGPTLREDAMYAAGHQSGVKVGWNLCVADDDAGYQRAMSSSEHIGVLRSKGVLR